MATMKWTMVDGDKMPLMEKKIRDELKMTAYKINECKEDLATKQEELIEKAQRKEAGVWIAQIGKEMETIENEIRKLTEKKHMLEYFLNDEIA